VPEDSQDESTARNNRTQSELGRLLAAAESYRVFASDKPIGWVDHVRYERHADHPDEIIVRSSRRLLGARRRAVAFEAVEEVRPSERMVVVRITQSAFERSPLA
jgi:hypothetical protein